MNGRKNMEKELTPQEKAQKLWEWRNPDKARYRRKKSAAKTFLLNDIEDKDLNQFIGYLENLKNRMTTIQSHERSQDND